MTAWGRAPKGWASVSAGDTSPGVAKVPSTAAPATASCNQKATTVTFWSGYLYPKPFIEPVPKRSVGLSTHCQTHTTAPALT